MRSASSVQPHRFSLANLLMFLLLLCLAPAQVNAQAVPIGIAVGSDNLTRLLWNNPDGGISLWQLDGSGNVSAQNSYGPYAGWLAQGFAAGPDNSPRILWNHTADGAMSLWRLDPSGASFTQATYGPYAGWSAVSVGVGGNNAPRIVWNHTADSQMSLWNITPDTNFTQGTYGPYSGYTAFRVAAGPNSIPRTLWNKSDGSISLWYSTADAANYAHSEYGPYPGWSDVALAVDSTNAARVLWSHPSDGTVSLWKVAGDGTFTQQTYTEPAGYSPVALAAGTGGDVRLLWSNGGGSALVWTIQSSGVYDQTYPASPQVSYIAVNPSTITAGGGAEMAVHLTSSAPNGIIVNLSSSNNLVQMPPSIQTPQNSAVLYFTISTTAGANDYTPVTISATAAQNPATTATTTVTVYTPGGIVTGGGGTGGGGTGGGGTGGGGTGTGGGGTGTGGGGTGTGGGGTGTGGGGTGTGGGASYGHYEVTYTGGTITTQDGSGAGTVNPTTDNYGYSASARLVGSSNTANSTSISATLNSPLTAKFHWVADTGTNSPPPAQVSVTQTCNFNWSMSDYDRGVSGKYDTSFGQSGDILVGTSNSSGGSKTSSVTTNGNTDFTVSCTPSLQISGYVTSSCSYDLIGYQFMAAATYSNISLKVDQDLQIFPPATITRFTATVSGPTSVVLDSMKISVDGNTPITATTSAGSLTGYIDWPSDSAANPSEHTVSATALAHDGATSLSLDSTQPQGNGRAADDIIADLRLKSLTFGSASGSTAPLTLRVKADSSPGNNDGVVAMPQVLWDIASTGLPYNPTRTNPAGYIMGSKPQFTFAISKPNGADPEIGATVGLTLTASAHPNTSDADIVLKDTKGQPVAVALPTATLPSDNPLLNKIAAYPVSITDLGIWLKFTKPATPVWVRHRSYAASSGASIQQFGTTFYTVLATPTAPMTQPWTRVLDYACAWASGKSDATNATIALCNGFYNNSYYNPTNHAWYTSDSPEIFHLDGFLRETAGPSSAPSGLQGQCNDFADFLVCLSRSVGAKPIQSQKSDGGFYYSHVIYAGTTTAHTPMPAYFYYHQWTTDGTSSSGNIFDSAVRPDNAATAIPVNEALSPYLSWLSPSTPPNPMSPFVPTVVN